MAEEWSEELKRFDERTRKRRARAKEQDDKAREVIRDAEERPDIEKPAE